jgi:hypothetical protein
LGALLSDPIDEPERKNSTLRKAPPGRARAITGLPDDPSLPALVALRAACRARTTTDPIELFLRGYTPGSRATLEARIGCRRIAIKAYAEYPASEAALYDTLAAAGLAGDSGARVPPLLARERNLNVLFIGWLDGPTAQELVESGHGQRAGELAAWWLQRVACLPVNLGPPFGAARMLSRGRKWADALGAADPMLGAAARALIGVLERMQPKEGTPKLVHGTFYARHLLDLGDGPGVIDWQRFGQGPMELDAGMFLATIWRIGLRHKRLAREAARAEEAFLAGTEGLMNERALAWHRAAALLRLADRQLKRRSGNWAEQAHGQLREAARLAMTARPTLSVSRPQRRDSGWRLRV